MTVSTRHVPGTYEQDTDEPKRHRFTREEYYKMGDAAVFREGFRDKRVELIDGEILDKDSDLDPPPAIRFNREQYYQMAEAGLFEGMRVELIDGEIYDMAPMKDLHAVAMGIVRDVLMDAFPDCWVRDQLPLPTANDAEPSPDFAVVAGKPREYKGQGHPREPLLVVEVSDTTLRFDRGRKASMYAAAGIADYWIVNLTSNCVEVMRSPVEDAAAPLGWRYASQTVVEVGAFIASLARPATAIAVSDLLP